MPEARRLTTKADWDAYLRGFQLPRRNDGGRMPWHAIDRVLQRHVPPAPLDVVEVGCAASAWLPAFAARGDRCWGLDYSPTGCRMAAANLRHYGASARIWCADLAQPGVAEARFDVVFSNGLVEHFSDTAGILRALAQLARPTGLLVTIVPNLAGLAGAGFRRVNRASFAQHVVLSAAALGSAHRAVGLELLHVDYCGAWFPYLWSALPAGAPPGLAFALKLLVHASARPAWALAARTGRYAEGRRLSPWVLSIARRPGQWT